MRITDARDLGGLVRTARLARGWSQQQAGDAAGVSRRLVNLIEGGEHPNAEVWRVLALLDALGVRLEGAVDVASEEHALEAADSGPARDFDDFDLDAHLARFRTDVGLG